MFSTARPIPFGLPAPWLRQFDSESSRWVFVNPATTPPTITTIHPGFSEPVFYDSDSEDAEEGEQESVDQLEDVAESSSSSSSLYAGLPTLDYTPPVAAAHKRSHRRRNANAAIALLEKLEVEGPARDRWLRLKRDRGRKEARQIVLTTLFSTHESSPSVLQNISLNAQLDAEAPRSQKRSQQEEASRKVRQWRPTLPTRTSNVEVVAV